MIVYLCVSSAIDDDLPILDPTPYPNSDETGFHVAFMNKWAMVKYKIPISPLGRKKKDNLSSTGVKPNVLTPSQREISMPTPILVCGKSSGRFLMSGFPFSSGCPRASTLDKWLKISGYMD